MKPSRNRLPHQILLSIGKSSRQKGSWTLGRAGLSAKKVGTHKEISLTGCIKYDTNLYR